MGQTSGEFAVIISKKKKKTNQGHKIIENDGKNK